MRIVKKDIVVEFNDAKINIRPRNLKLINIMADDSEDLHEILCRLIVSWSGVLDEENVEVEFSKENLSFLDAKDAKRLLNLIGEKYNLEMDQEKN